MLSVKVPGRGPGGDVATVSPDPAHAHLFDAGTGLRIVPDQPPDGTSS